MVKLQLTNQPQFKDNLGVYITAQKLQAVSIPHCCVQVTQNGSLYCVMPETDFVLHLSLTYTHSIF